MLILNFKAYYFVGIAMIAYGIAFVGTLTIELPFVGLEKLLLGSKNLFYKTYIF